MLFTTTLLTRAKNRKTDKIFIRGRQLRHIHKMEYFGLFETKYLKKKTFNDI